MPRLIACRGCGEHMRVEESSCPHCGALVHDERSVLARGAGAVVLGLALAGCPSDDDDNSSNTSVEPEYGVPATDSDSVTGPTTSATMSGTTTATTAGTETATGESGTTETGGEPEYGVPETDSVGTSGSSDSGTTIEPDYGVPTTG